METLKMVNKPTYDELEKRIQELEKVLCQTKDAEKRRQKEKSVLQSLIQSPKTISILCLDTEYHYLFFNNVHKATVKKAWGVEVMIDTNLLNYISNKEDRALAQDNFDRALAGETFTLVQEFGSIERHFWESTYSPILNLDGHVTGLSVYSTNITEKRNIEKKLIKSKKLLQSIADNSILSISAKNIKGEYIFINNVFEKNINLNSERILGKTDFDFLSKKKAEKYLEEDKEIIRTNKILKREEQFIRDENEKYFFLTKFPLIDDTGNAYGVGIISDDISERKALEVEQNKNEQLFQRLFDDSIDGMVIGDKNGKYIKVNNAFANLIGYSQEELIGMTTSDITYPGDIDLKSKLTQQLWSGERVGLTTEKRYIKKDGTIIWSETTVFVIRDADGGVQFTVGRLRDVTKQKITEAEKKDNELKFELVTNAIDDVFWMSTIGIGKMIYISPGYRKLWERSRKSLYQSPKSFLQAIHPDDLAGYLEVVKNQHRKKKHYEYQYRIIRKNGDIRWIHERASAVDHLYHGEQLMAGVCTDITEFKANQKKMLNKSKKIEEKNIALNVLIENKSEDQKKWGDLVLKNFNSLVFPYYEKLKQCTKMDDAFTILDIIEDNTFRSLDHLNKSVSNSYRAFTPMEIQVADLIKVGKSSKEIGNLLNMGTRSVYFHRNNIRKKLNIYKSKTNLRTTLLSLS